MRSVRTGTLEIAYEESGPPGGEPVVLLHGFPDDVRTWDGVAPALAAAGHRVIVPWLRGYGPTRFLDTAVLRSGEQAALGSDLLGLMNALHIKNATLAGYDWGGRAACVVAALYPERVHGLLTVGGYNIQDIAAATRPADAEAELRHWYQWYFCTPRGEAGLTANRRELGRKLWQMWSPDWGFDDATFDATAASWDNEDYVRVVIHSYRHRYGLVQGDPVFEVIESSLAQQPPISVPTINLHGASDGVAPPMAADPDIAMFTGPYRREIISGAGHFFPREAPSAIIEALRALLA